MAGCKISRIERPQRRGRAEDTLRPYVFLPYSDPWVPRSRLYIGANVTIYSFGAAMSFWEWAKLVAISLVMSTVITATAGAGLWLIFK